MAVEEIPERRAMTPHMLIGHIETFIRDNEHSGCVEYRWLADALKNDIVKIRQVRSNGLDEVNRAAVSIFRRAEIEHEKARRFADIARLDAEASKLTA